MTDQEELEVFGKKYYDDANRINNDVRFSVFSNQEQVEFYKKRAQRNRSGIQNVIAYALADGDDFIIEGFHLRPEVIAEKLKERWDQVRYILLYKSNIEEIEQWIKANNHPNDRAVKKTFDEATYPKIAWFIHEFGETMKQEANQYWLESYNMSEWNFWENLNHVVNKIIL